eukprot:Gb_34294 [translate_table: standard]
MEVKLVVNKKTQRIMYAEAGKDFVDMLFSFLILPTGAIAKLLAESNSKSPEGMAVSCITNLYNSVQMLCVSFMQKADKTGLLEPKVFSPSYANDLLRIQFLPTPVPPPPPRYYICQNSGNRYSGITNVVHHVSTQHGSRCPCGYSINTNVHVVQPSSQVMPEPVAENRLEGYVKESLSLTFLITDDLCVMPNYPTTTVILLNKLQLKDLTELQEHKMSVSANEVMELLKAAMVSTTALNDVFSVVLASTPKGTKASIGSLKSQIEDWETRCAS